MPQYLILIQLFPNEKITGKLEEAMKRSGFVQFQSDLVYTIETNRKDDDVMALALQTLRSIGFVNVRVIVAKVISQASP